MKKSNFGTVLLLRLAAEKPDRRRCCGCRAAIAAWAYADSKYASAGTTLGRFHADNDVHLTIAPLNP